MPRKEIGNMLDITNKQNHNDNYKELYGEAARLNTELSATYAKLVNLKEGPQGPTGPMGPQGPKGDKGDRGLTGETGKAFTYADFTSDQLLGLKGPKGDTGATGPQGAKGDQGIQGIQGPKGDKGDKGDTGLTGPQGPQGIQGVKGDTGAQGPQGIQGLKGDGLQIDGVVATIGELPTGTTKSTYLVGTTLYFRAAGSSTWTAGPNIKGVDGKAGTTVTIVDGYIALDGVKTLTKVDYSSDFADLVRVQQLKNLLGSYGGFHKDTDGDGLADGSIKAGTNNGFATWNNGQQSFSSSSASFYFKSPPTQNLKDNTCYIAIMDVTSSNSTNRSLSEKIQVYGTSALASSFAYKNEEKVAYTSFKTSTGTTVSEAIFLKYDTAINTYDNLRLYEIPQSEYDAIATMTPAQIKAKYPYTEMHSHVIGDVTGLTEALAGKSDSTHNHNGVYAPASHTHTTSQVTGLDSKLTSYDTHLTDNVKHITAAERNTWNSKASGTHTHAIADVSGLQTELNGKLTKTQADNLYAPLGSTGGTSTGGTSSIINVNKRFGFVGDGTTDNYQAFKDLVAFVNANPGQTVEWDALYNGQPAVYRVNQYVTISNIDGSYAAGSPEHLLWKAKNLELITHGVKFINMPLNGFTKTKAFTGADGTWHYAKEEPITLFNFSECDGLKVDDLLVDGENYRLKFAAGFTSKKGENPKWSDGKPLAEGRGHGVILSGIKNGIFNNIKSINQIVDGIAIGFTYDASLNVTQSHNTIVNNATATGCGRLGISGLGLHGVQVNNFIAESSGTNQNSDGHYIGFSPTAGIDIEPHHSPVATDNNTTTSYKTDLWNGSVTLNNGRIRYNVGSQVACTSTLLTRNVEFNKCVIRPPKDATVDHMLILLSAQNVKFVDCDVDGYLSDGALSRVLFYAATYVNETTGVIQGQPANVWSEVLGGQWKGVEPWVNTDGVTTVNDVSSGEYGSHNITFKDVMMTDVKFTLRTIRRFIFENVILTITPNAPISKLFMWNASIEDMVLINKKSTSITLDLGNGDSQSDFDTLKLKGLFDWVSNTKKYKVATISSENIDVYAYTRVMEYILSNGTTQTPPADTTAPNAPTVNPVYNNSTTITGTAEANSTVLFTGGFTGQTTANNSGAYTIVASNLTAGQTITVKARDAAGNTSAGTTVTIQTAQSGAGANLWPTAAFDFTNKTIPQLGGSGSKYAMNSVYTISNNEAQPLNMTGSGDTITFNAVAGTSKYGFFTLDPNTQYTIRVKASDTIANASDLVTMIGGDYIWPNPKVVDITFTTDSAGKYGYDFNGVTYGAADATKGLFHRANGGKNSTTTYKIWLNKGATSTATWSS